MRVDLSGLDDIIAQLNKMGNGASELVDKMLIAGAEVAKDALRESISYNGHIDTGSMLDNTDYEAPRISKYNATAKYVSVYPRGNDGKGVSNALKGFVLNYGSPKRGIIGTGWFDEAAEQADSAVDIAMTRVFEENSNL